MSKETGIDPATLHRFVHRQGGLSADGIDRLAEALGLTDRRRERRALTVGELLRVVQSAEAGPRIENIPGPDRAMMYVLSAWTGFRRRELSFLTLRSFDVDASPATATVTAA